MASPIVISGSGISGLICALVLTERGEGHRVWLVERNADPGGLLRRFNYGEWGDFDYGMHNVMETGIADLDRLVLGLLPEEEWQILDGAKRDLAGLYLNGTLQRHTPYIDIRNLSRAEYETCLAALFEHMALVAEAPPSEPATQTAEEYAVARFGAPVAARTLVPAVEKIFCTSAGNLDSMATRLTPMTRLAFCDAPLVELLTVAPFLRDRIAWSDQRTLPLDRSSGRRAAYPVKYGIYRLVEAMLHRIVAAGGHVITNAEISSISVAGGRIRSVTVRSGNETNAIQDVGRLIWTASIPALGRHLGVDAAGLRGDKPLTTVIANLVVDRLPEAMGDLYYFFCYDPAFRTFRVTNFTQYSPGAPRNGGYPVCLELLTQQLPEDHAALVGLALDEYQRFGITDPATNVLFARAEVLDSGFPLPSLANIEGLRQIRQGIAALELANLDLVGILARDDLFFQTDVIAHAYETVH